MKLSDYENKTGLWFVREDGSGGLLGDLGIHNTFLNDLIPPYVQWVDWPSERTIEDRPAVMYISSQEDVTLVRSEIAKRWKSMIKGYEKYQLQKGNNED